MTCAPFIFLFRTICRTIIALASLWVAHAFAAEPVSTGSPTLAAVRARGVLACGVIGSSPGFSLPDSRGAMRGIDADECRAIAAAVFGDASKVRFVSLTAQQRLTALQTGEVDVVFGNLTWTMSRETRSGIQFASIYFFDGASFLVEKRARVDSATQLRNASICMLAGPAEAVSQDYFSRIRVPYKAVIFSDGEELRSAFLARRCDAYMSDASSLANFKVSMGEGGEAFKLLPEVISKEPLGGAVRKGDDRWFDIVRYTHFAMVAAEELGIASTNVRTLPNSADPAVRRFLGHEGDLGASMGLDDAWAANIVAAVGNYGETWLRNFGATGLPRGLNRLWMAGGLQFAPPLR